MNYISFSLWGEKPIYNIGAIKNAELWKEIYPEWQMVVYYDDTVPISTISSLEEKGVKVINCTGESISGPFWRFFSVDFDDSEFCIFRDTDSRISQREKLAVDEWINSKKTLHVMRDHPAHGIPFGNDKLGILAGMWGIRSKKIPLVKMIENYHKEKKFKYGIDQSFLKIVYSIFDDDKITHDEFFEKKPFPIKRENGRFIGERITEFDQPLTDDYKILI